MTFGKLNCNHSYFTSRSKCSASFRDIGPWNHSSRESIWCFIELSAPIDDIEILCTWSPILIVCWFDKFECVSIVDCTFEVTKPKTPPPGALVAKGPIKDIKVFSNHRHFIHNSILISNKKLISKSLKYASYSCQMGLDDCPSLWLPREFGYVKCQYDGM